MSTDCKYCGEHCLVCKCHLVPLNLDYEPPQYLFFMKWISVKEQLPEDDQTILVYNPRASLFQLGYYLKDEDSFYSIESYFAFPLHVTHWMPLPQPPKE